MKKIFLGAVIVFITNLILQGVISYFLNRNSGEIIVSDLMKQDSITYTQNIIICNFEKKSIENIEFRIENGILKNYLSDKEIVVENSTRGIIIFKTLYPERNYTIQLEIKRNESSLKEPIVYSLNHQEKNFKLNKASEINNDNTPLILSVLSNSIIMAILYAIFYYYIETKINELKTSVKSKEEVASKAIEKANELEVIINKFKNNNLKYRILNNRELKDLKKENDFYQYLISKLIENKESIRPDQIYDFITQELKTYGVKSNKIGNLGVVDIITEILKDDKD